MIGLPVFIERAEMQLEDQDTILQQIRCLLYIRGVWPLAYAESVDQVPSVLEAFRNKNQRLALFVVNLSGIEDHIPYLDEVIGETPVVLFRRELLWLREFRDEWTGQSGLTTRIGQMRPRLTAVWPFGPKNAYKVARHVAVRIESYLRFGDFRSLEESVRLDRVRPDVL